MAHCKQIEPASRGQHRGEERWRVGWLHEGRQVGKTVYGKNAGKRFCLDFEDGSINPATGEYFAEEKKKTKQTVQNAFDETKAERTFGNLAARFMRKNREENDHSPSTLEDYQQLLDTHILETLRELPLCDIELTDIEDMVRTIKNSNRKRKAGPRTINKCLILTRAIFQYGIDLRWCTDNPAKRKKIIKYQKRDGRVLQPTEIKRIIHNTIQPFDIALQLLAYTGARRGEVVALQWGDIDFEGATLLIERTFKTRRFGIQPVKTKQRRRVALPDDVLRCLRTYTATVREVEPDAWLFPNSLASKTSDDLFPVGGDVLLRRFKDALKRSSLSGYVIHDMRHSFISHLAAANVDPASVQGMTGHSNLTTLMNIYTHTSMAGKANAANTMAQLLGDTDRNAARTHIEQFPEKSKVARSG